MTMRLSPIGWILLFAAACGDDGASGADACDGRATLRVCVRDTSGNPATDATVTMIQNPGDVPYEARVGTDGCADSPVETNAPWQVSAQTPDGCITDGPTEADVSACMTTEITVDIELCPG